MNELLDELYQFTLERRLEQALVQNKAAFRDCRMTEDLLWKRLVKTLDPEQKRLLHELTEARDRAAGMEQEAVFRCALSLGLSLSRL